MIMDCTDTGLPSESPDLLPILRYRIAIRLTADDKGKHHLFTVHLQDLVTAYTVEKQAEHYRHRI